jgi:hypothetical protein
MEPANKVQSRVSDICLDRIVILVHHETLINPPKWITDNFTLTPCASGTENKTEVRMICLADGTYIKLVALLHDDPSDGLGLVPQDQEYGIIAFSLTSTDGAEENFARLESKLAGDASGLKYNRPLQKRCKQEDGTDLKWEITSPDIVNGYYPGGLPFFCHDITDRSLRVSNSPSDITHPTLVYGITHLSLFVPANRYSFLLKSYCNLLSAQNLCDAEDIAIFEMKRICPLLGVDPMRLIIHATVDESPKFELILGGFTTEPRFFKLPMETDNESKIYIDLNRYPRSKEPPIVSSDEQDLYRREPMS